MASTINAQNTSSGVAITPDSSGVLQLQTAGTTAVTVDASQNVTFTQPLSLTAPNLGTPSALVGTNISGTANNLNAGLGVSQTWAAQTRVSGTPYTNLTGKPIQVYVYMASSASNPTLNIVLAGLTIHSSSQSVYAPAGNYAYNTSFIVPNGVTYTITWATATVAVYELR